MPCCRARLTGSRRVFAVGHGPAALARQGGGVDLDLTGPLVIADRPLEAGRVAYGDARVVAGALRVAAGGGDDQFGVTEVQGGPVGGAGDEPVAVGVVDVLGGVAVVGDGVEAAFGVPGQSLGGAGGGGALGHVAGVVVGEAAGGGVGVGAGGGDRRDLVGGHVVRGPDAVGPHGVTSVGVVVGLGASVAEGVEGPGPVVGVSACALWSGAGRGGLGPGLGQPAQLVIGEAFDLVGGAVGLSGDRGDVADLVVGVAAAEPAVECARGALAFGGHVVVVHPAGSGVDGGGLSDLAAWGAVHGLVGGPVVVVDEARQVAGVGYAGDLTGRRAQVAVVVVVRGDGFGG